MGVVSDFVQQRLVEPMRDLQAVEVTAAIFIGVLSGVLPLPGAGLPVMFFLCRLCSFVKAQYALTSSVNLLSSPLQIILLPFWGRGVAGVLGKDTSAFTATRIKNAMSEGILSFLSVCSDVILYGLLAWCCAAVAMVALVLVMSRNVNKKIL